MSIRPTLPRILVAAAFALALAAGVAVAGPALAADDPPRAQYHEMHANCTVNHTLSDDPIVFPGLPGASHNHSFIGNPTVNANSTPQSLVGGSTSCEDTKDASGYWFPTLLQRGVPLQPDKPTVYYKSDVKDYRTVKPFPAGFKLLVGDAKAPNTAAFKGNYQCTGYKGADFPASCPAGSTLQVRLTSPSCWDGVHLDTADHKSHMAWPVNGVCPADHPVPLPMLEIKLPYPLHNGDTGGLAYASGGSFTFHYDFMNGWDAARQSYLVSYCINGGRQCNGFGEDPKKP
ncbi:DUF1996 domain-containing protein [Dactylosporangium sp. NPDC051541]|uniref:DUF1996 domain-containing protein n=1 Tax=Dactylosporangium sp. NPDC051541 TaxID=3363977 RepID=UPI00378F4A4B